MNALMEATTVMKMLIVQILVVHLAVDVNRVIQEMVLTVKVSNQNISTISKSQFNSTSVIFYLILHPNVELNKVKNNTSTVKLTP